MYQDGLPGQLYKAWRAATTFKPHSAGTGNLLFAQFSAAVVRHKASDAVICAIWAWFKYDTTLSEVV